MKRRRQGSEVATWSGRLARLEGGNLEAEIRWDLDWRLREQESRKENTAGDAMHSS